MLYTCKIMTLFGYNIVYFKRVVFKLDTYWLLLLSSVIKFIKQELVGL